MEWKTRQFRRVTGVDKTIARLNIEHIEKQLENISDKVEKARLHALLADEQQKLKTILERESGDQKSA